MHSFTGTEQRWPIRGRAAGVLAAERDAASAAVGAMGVAGAADAIWTGHSRPAPAVPRRSLRRAPQQTLAALQPEEVWRKILLTRTGKDLREKNLVFLKSVISWRYSGKMKEQKIGWRLLHIGAS